MDFIVGLSSTCRKNDSILVIVYMLTKSAHFISIKFMYSAEEYERLHLDEIVSLHVFFCPSFWIEVPN